MALATAIPEIGNEQLSTMQTLALCASLHRQTAILPHEAQENPIGPIKKSHAQNLKNPGEQYPERRALC
ncbi:MAG: hypothetical protein WBV90_01130 [Terrimicrobiaceae bacterium]